MNKGFTLIEMVLVVLILGIISSVAMPVSRLGIIRSKEMDLRRSLITIRRAIDKYKDEFDKVAEHKRYTEKDPFRELRQIDSTGYPETLDSLIEMKIIRRVPKDPMQKDLDDDIEKWWGLRSSTDERDSTMTNARDIYDIYSKSKGEALDGSKYKEW